MSRLWRSGNKREPGKSSRFLVQLPRTEGPATEAAAQAGSETAVGLHGQHARTDTFSESALYLPKPFTISDLTARVREALERD